MRVADIMTSDVVTVRPETSVREVARILLDRGISANDHEQNQPVQCNRRGAVAVVRDGSSHGFHLAWHFERRTPVDIDLNQLPLARPRRALLVAAVPCSANVLDARP